MATIQWPGVAGPSIGTPRRQPNSIRRTTTIDGIRADGPAGDVSLRCAGRDLLTDRNSVPRLLDEVSVDLVAGPPPDYTLVAIRVDRSAARLGTLVGFSAKRGFRRAVRDALIDDEPSGSLLVALLDDVAIATSLSRLALLQNGSMSTGGSSRTSATGICSGWRAGGVMELTVKGGGSSVMTEGAIAPLCDETTDPDGWHHMAPMPLLGFRRRRLLDLSTDGTSGLVRVDSMFRDSYVNDQGVRMIMHEYTMTGEIDAVAGVVTSCDAVPRVLPGPQCHFASGSGQRLAGVALHDISTVLRHETDPESTCTHLTDHLAAMVGIDGLLRALTAP